MAKTPKKPRRPNPIAYDLAATPKYRKRVNDKDDQSKFHTDEKKGSLGRAAKHKKSPLEEARKGALTFAEFYQVGDKLKITKGPLKKLVAVKKGEKKKDVTLRQPSGPGTTLGITVDGKYYLIDEDDVALLTEAFAFDDLTEWSMVATKSGIPVPISDEEGELIASCKGKVYNRTLDEREQEVARKMVSRGVLYRGKDEQGTYFTSSVPKLTRS